LKAKAHCFGIVEQARTPCHDFIDKAYGILKADAEGKAPGLLAALKAKSKAHGCVAIDTLGIYEEQTLKDAHDVDVKCPPFLCIQRVGKCDIRTVAQPFLLSGQFLFGYVGSLFVALVPLSEISKTEYSLDVWLDGQNKKDDPDVSYFVLKADSALWVPPGWCAITVGIDERSEADLRKARRLKDKSSIPFTQFLVLPVFDKKRIQHIPDFKGFFATQSLHLAKLPLPQHQDAAKALKEWRIGVDA